MGALHSGHATLIEAARRGSDFVVVTVFVNPTQFGPNEDLAKYPRTLESDRSVAEKGGAAVLFTPAEGDMYPAGEETRVRVGRTAAALCGEHRPGHFEGVTTVVAKLFALVGPCRAWFGRKDYQQLQVITRMARDLFLPVEVIGVATVREPDGLALSSRNRFLSPESRERALAISRGLGRAHALYAAGERRAGTLARACRDEVERTFDSIDYVTLADADSVVPFDDDATIRGRAVLAVAARIAGTRLIDNLVLGEDPAPRGAES
jgi:pantoate--beta-alanine ligase